MSSQSYAEVTKKNIHNEDDAAENMHADLQYNQTHPNGHNGIHHELNAEENLEANLAHKGDVNTDFHRSGTGQSSSRDVGSSSNVTGKLENQQQKSHNKKHTSRGT
ncbi:3164_t:CDS:1, partial [Acaulospora colombiana]